jgi:oligopeptidase B
MVRGGGDCGIDWHD